MPTNTQPKWSDIKPKLSTLQRDELVELLKGLFDQSPANKLFLASHLAPTTLSMEMLEPYRKRIVDQFFPKRGFGKLNLRDARQAIRDYKKTTSDLSGTAELMMIYVENGTEFTNQYGDIDESFYNSLEAVLHELATLLTFPEGQALYSIYAKRLQEVKYNSAHIGWGYGDAVSEIVTNLEAEVPERTGDTNP